MKKLLVVLIIFGVWAILDPGVILNASDDPMTAAGVTKLNGMELS